MNHLKSSKKLLEFDSIVERADFWQIPLNARTSLRSSGKIKESRAVSIYGEWLTELKDDGEPQPVDERPAVPMWTAGDFDYLVSNLELSLRTGNCLERSNLKTIGDVINRTADDLPAIKNFGRKSLGEIREISHSTGLSLKDDDFLQRSEEDYD